TGHEPGALTITAELDGVQGTASLTVTDAIMTGLAISPLVASVPLGVSQTYVATASFSDGTTQDVSNTAAWSSSDEAVATMSGATARTLALGATTIDAIVGEISAAS